MRLGQRALAVVAAALLVGVPAASAAAKSPAVMPPQSSSHGHTYAEWSVLWWQWVLQTPVHAPGGAVAHSWAINDGPVDCSFGQSGHVWFLAGRLRLPIDPIVANRSCTIPSGTALFFPLTDAWADNSEAPPTPDDTFTEAQLRGFIAPRVDGATGGFVSVDGATLAGLSASSPYRVKSPVFSYTTTADNVIAQLLGQPGFPAREVDGAVADGLYVMLPPLSVGTHVIHFGVPGNQDITYHVTVAPRGQT
jgi:hypothetical protein